MITRNLPALARGIDKSSDWRQELRVKWRSPDFTATDAQIPLVEEQLRREKNGLDYDNVLFGAPEPPGTFGESA